MRTEADHYYPSAHVIACDCDSARCVSEVAILTPPHVYDRVCAYRGGLPLRISHLRLHQDHDLGLLKIVFFHGRCLFLEQCFMLVRGYRLCR